MEVKILAISKIIYGKEEDFMIFRTPPLDRKSTLLICSEYRPQKKQDEEKVYLITSPEKTTKSYKKSLYFALVYETYPSPFETWNLSSALAYHDIQMSSVKIEYEVCILHRKPRNYTWFYDLGESTNNLALIKTQILANAEKEIAAKESEKVVVTVEKPTLEKKDIQRIYDHILSLSEREISEFKSQSEILSEVESDKEFQALPDARQETIRSLIQKKTSRFQLSSDFKVKI
jgi:hypothetical protein